MKFSFLLFIFLLATLSSCEYKHEAKFFITNFTETRIDSVCIKSNDHTAPNHYISINPNESKTYYFDMTDLPKIDGDYNIIYKDRSNYPHFKRFGYFTNGASMEDSTIVNIYSDSVTISQVYTRANYY